MAYTTIYDPRRFVDSSSPDAGLGLWADFTPTLTTSSAATWSAGTQITARYLVVGKTIVVAFELDNSSISANTALSLRVAIPGGYTANKQMGTSLEYQENGAAFTVGYVQVGAGATVINLYHADTATNWATSVTNATHKFTITFEVQ